MGGTQQHQKAQSDVAVGQNLFGTFLGLGKPPHEVVFFKGFLGVHRGTGVLTHSHVVCGSFSSRVVDREFM